MVFGKLSAGELKTYASNERNREMNKTCATRGCGRKRGLKRVQVVEMEQPKNIGEPVPQDLIFTGMLCPRCRRAFKKVSRYLTIAGRPNDDKYRKGGWGIATGPTAIYL